MLKEALLIIGTIIIFVLVEFLFITSVIKLFQYAGILTTFTSWKLAIPITLIWNIFKLIVNK